MHATTIAVDPAKSVFQVSVANQADRIIDRKRLTRSQFHRFIAQQAPSLIVMEACATSHYWSQVAQQYGHTPKLLTRSTSNPTSEETKLMQRMLMR